ncbi:MAG TPA: amidohydrolase family protein [Methanobacteriaceae archaeon]|nr:amidohydrolase family protein [Methanobacteriaceae archaeon]
MESKELVIENTVIMGSEIRKASVRIENTKIVEIGKNIDSTGCDVLNGQNKILMPGLVNTHTHLSMTLLRGLADDLPLQNWLEDHIWPVEAHLNGDHCYAGALLAALEMIKTGTTCCNDMYFFMDDVARALDEAGIRGVICHGMIDTGDSQKRKKEIKETERIIEKCHNTSDGRIKVSLGPHAPYTCSEELLRWTRKKADSDNIKIHMHVSETEKEVHDFLESHGKRPFEYLDDIGILGPDLLAAHAVWLSDDEMDLIKEREVKLSHNPLSNMKLASGISPVNKLVDRDVCMSLGTDGAASNNNLDLFQEIKTATLLQKVDKLDPTVLPASEVLKMATTGGAAALGLDDVGSIEVGKKADLILMNTRSPNLTPFRNPVSHLVYAAEGSNVDTVICNGEVLMQNRQVQALDEVEVIQIAEEAALDLLARS